MNQRPDDRDIAMHLDLLRWTLDYNNDESVYLTIGNVYEAFHRPDSAYHYLSLGDGLGRYLYPSHRLSGIA